MLSCKKLALAAMALSFCATTPVLGADMPAKPDPAAALKAKAEGAIEKGKAEIAKGLGIQQNATAPKSEDMNVTQETVTVETPQGTASETTITVTPETPAAPASPTAPAPK